MLRRWLALAGIGALVLGGTALAASHVGARPTATPKWVTTAKQRLSKLDVKQAGSMVGFQPREESFGPDWYDVDLNDCDTRNDILQRDLKQIVFQDGSDCTVAKGMLRDPYTAKTINFIRGKNTSSEVQIDHIVALAASWRTGARQWTAELRLLSPGAVSRRRPNEQQEEGQGRGWLASAKHPLPMPLRRETDRDQDEVRALGDPAGTDGDDRRSQRLLTDV